MLGADNSLSYALEQTPGLTNGNYPLTDFKLVGIPEHDVRIRPCCGDLDNCEIGLRIGAHYLLLAAA